MNNSFLECGRNNPPPWRNSSCLLPRWSSPFDRLDFNRLFANLSGSKYLIVRAILQRGKQGQRVFKIGASGEAKSLFKSSAGSDHSVNNLIKKRGKGLFACRLPHASLLSRQWRPIDRPTGRIYHYHHFHQRRSSLSNRLDFNRLFANLSGSKYLIVRAILQVRDLKPAWLSVLQVCNR